MNDEQYLEMAALGLTGDAANALLTQGDNGQIKALIDSGQVGQYAEVAWQAARIAEAGRMAQGARAQVTR